ncbi:PLP-dependent aminotransferase family protein [Georgenia sp. EYE_87]|uniref:aminotransferase-like domain-containing protein n=1 Tax=Georgenia sp. EYE_87 TaxID=2853448 RepID=UPI0020060AD0|nr:PLP-dependent aminotransferase family protein [Georgenia sp. EYE_87]MCK6210379.1 PLP-dependent aminotransferase family protein [Georgenia sp. EYE_87]
MNAQGAQAGQGEHSGQDAAAAAAPAGTRLDPWFTSYADRAHGMRASEVRSLFAVANRPEVVSLAGGMPNIDGLPLDFLAEMTAKLLRERGPRALQYGGGQGEEELREQIVEVMRYDHIHAHPDDIVVTTGSQQALDLVTEIFINPGDVVVAEAPSYVGALGVFRAYQADVVHVPMDDDGLVPAELDRTLTELKRAGRTVKFLYTVPNFHNPAGVTLTLERRPEIVEICRRHHVLILEDNPYGLLGFDADPLPALKSFDADGVVYLGSFSKTFAPGYRVGWALAPHAVREKLVLASESAILSPTMMGQLSIATYLSTYDWYGQVKQYRSMYRERRDAMLGALAEFLPEASWTVPEGGFYTWVTLPAGLDAQAMLPRAVTNLVAYVSGTAFYADGQGRDHVRLSFCYPTPERIREGVRRLATVVHAESELVSMFGTATHHDRIGDSVEFPSPDQV